MSILNLQGLQKLRDEMSEWVLSKDIMSGKYAIFSMHNLWVSAGFMSQPADLAQQLEAQREIAIREISSGQTRSPESISIEIDPEERNQSPEVQPDSENIDHCHENNQTTEDQPLPTFPLFDSCFEALDLTNRTVIAYFLPC